MPDNGSITHPRPLRTDHPHHDDRTSRRPGRRPAPRRPRVCVVGSGPLFFSGISLYTCRLANAFAGSWDTSAVLMRRLLPRRLYPGAARVGQSLSAVRFDDAVEVVDGVDWFTVPSILRAVRHLVARRPDVVVMQWWTGAVLHNYLLIALVAKAIGARIVLEMHETQDTGEARHPMARAHVRALLPPFLRCVAAIVVHSRYDEAAVRSFLPVGRRPVEVILHGPYDHLVDDAEEHGHRAGTSGGQEFTYLFFGTIRPYKGLELLVRAFSSLTPEEAAGRRLLVVGETWEGWEEPARLIEASPHRDRITFVNRYVPDSEARGYFERADAVVLPYRRSSASGPLHMAMSHGLPVAVSRVGGLEEAAEAYAGTTFLEPDDVASIVRALRSLPTAGRTSHPDPHSWSDTVDRFGTLFSALLEPAGAGSADRVRDPRRH